jgi:ferric-dicitrate binding protein FerR (iron transport regulator)
MKEMPGKDDITTIHRYLAGEMSPEESGQFELRTTQEPDLAQLLSEIRQIWDAADTYESPVFSNQPALTHFQSQIRTRVLRRRLTFALSSAAAVLLVILGIWTLFIKTGEQTLLYASEAINHTLPDGSIVEMREGARMIVADDFGSSARRVEIVHGEVFFDVVSDDARPFVIRNPWAEVRVTGTEFVVSVDLSAMTYTLKVTEGQVQFTPALNKKSISVDAGQGIRFHVTSRVIDRFNDVDKNAVSWRTGELVFKNTRMDKVIRDLESHYHVSLNLMSPQVRTCTFTAPLPYRDVPLKTILDALSTGLGITVEMKGENAYVLKGGRCK